MHHGGTSWHWCCCCISECAQCCICAIKDNVARLDSVCFCVLCSHALTNGHVTLSPPTLRRCCQTSLLFPLLLLSLSFLPFLSGFSFAFSLCLSCRVSSITVRISTISVFILPTRGEKCLALLTPFCLCHAFLVHYTVCPKVSRLLNITLPNEEVEHLIPKPWVLKCF